MMGLYLHFSISLQGVVLNAMIKYRNNLQYVKYLKLANVTQASSIYVRKLFFKEFLGIFTI
jgi:hypothetical protein